MSKLALLMLIISFNVSSDNFKKDKLSCEDGNPKDCYNLGISYHYGKGVEKNKQKAVKWYLKAAKQGLANAQGNLANMYRDGKGVEQNYQEAIKWYLKSAKQGYANAQYNLGFRYENGEGVEKDSKESVKWFTKAAKQGHANAQKKLKTINALEEAKRLLRKSENDLQQSRHEEKLIEKSLNNEKQKLTNIQRKLLELRKE